MAKIMQNLEMFQSLVNRTDALSKAESKQLHKLRRAIEVSGIPTNVSFEEMADYAIIIDNMGQVKGYISRSTNKEMRYAKRSNGKKAGKITANGIEAEALKELGLSTTDPHRLARMIAEIKENKKSVDKLKYATKYSHKVAAADKELEIEEMLCDDDDDESYDIEGIAVALAADLGMFINGTVTSVQQA